MRGWRKTTPLMAMPIAIKDNICTEGVKTTCGSRILENFVPPYDATVIGRLRAQQYCLIGKTNLDEFAMGSSTENSAFGPTRNPWNPAYVPGGSSGGSAAAVAADLCVAALGRIRGLNPAAGRLLRSCGTQAHLRASFALRVGRLCIFVGSDRHDYQGCAGCGDLLKVIAGCDPMDSTSADLECRSTRKPLKTICGG